MLVRLRRYGGIAATIRSTFTAGVAALACTARMIASSAEQSSHASRCCCTRTRSASGSVPSISSGSTSRISMFSQSFIIEKLLDRAHRVVVVDARCALRAPNQLRDLLIRKPLFQPERKDLFLLL